MSKSIFLIAHSKAKSEVIYKLFRYSGMFNLKGWRFTCTCNTALLFNNAGFHNESVLSGIDGGDEQLTAKIIDPNTRPDQVWFLLDPDQCHPHQSAIDALIRQCIKLDVPLALNWSTVEALIQNEINRGNK